MHADVFKECGQMQLTDQPEWKRLTVPAELARLQDLRAMFARDPSRRDRMTFKAGGIEADISRAWVDEPALAQLLSLAQLADLTTWRDRLLSGEPVNNTEQRPAWHSALRSPPQDPAVRAELARQREKMFAIAEQLRAGQFLGSTGRPIETVVCCGIGGSDLGPRLVSEAIGDATGQAAVRFATNIDPVDLSHALRGANPESTLIVAISKSFTTLETLENLKAALRWLAQAPGVRPDQHLLAVTSRPDKAIQFGVPAQNIIAFADWVGGRYSVWSACGLPVVLSHGTEAFKSLLQGAADIDAHFASEEPARNLPVLLGLLGLLYVNGFGMRARAVMPYAQRLRYMPAYLQQLEMESLGKRVSRDGDVLGYSTSPVVWGEVGTNGQHSVFQFLHQGSDPCPVDFITCRSFEQSTEARERLLYANALAQADALAFGDEVLGAPASSTHGESPGNRPSTFITIPDLSPRSIGALLALHEHRTFVQSVLWNINAFDQFGVEIGKKLLAQRVA
jgi:glucose-6-phosphate isomerase